MKLQEAELPGLQAPRRAAQRADGVRLSRIKHHEHPEAGSPEISPTGGGKDGGAPEAKPPRIEALDYLRGLLAVGVLAYHYHHWSVGNASHTGPTTGQGLGWAEDLLMKLGLYGVASFYVLRIVQLQPCKSALA